MHLLFELVKNPEKLILPKKCDHKHKVFTHDYDYECLRCGRRFDTDEDGTMSHG